MSLPRLPGIAVELDGREYVIPPVSIGALMQVQSKLESISAGNIMSAENMDTIITVAHAAIRRNYPEVTREQLLEMIDIGNLKDVFNAVVDVSGLRRKAKDAEGKIQPRDLSNGPTSSPMSAPVQDGLGTTS